MFVFSGKNNYYAIPFKYNQNPVPVHHIFLNIQYRSVNVLFARLEGGHEQLTSCALQRTNIENSKQIFPEKELRGQSPNFHIHVSVRDIPTIDLLILLQELCGPILGIYINRSQTRECGNWD
jgi:hypothetical protein